MWSIKTGAEHDRVGGCNHNNLLERVEVELIDVRFRRVAARRPEVLVTEPRRLADARRPDSVGARRRRSPGVGRTDVDVSRLVDREPRVVPRPLVERLATQRRRDDPGHRDERLRLIDFASSGHRSWFGAGRKGETSC